MNQEAWHQWRREGIGSSDAAVILGVSPWRTPLQLWNEKVYGDSGKKENWAMSKGKEMEPKARTWFENKMNVTLFPQNLMHESIPWIRASMDGLDMEKEIAVEFKFPSQEDHSVAVNNMIPEKYIPQVQHQLLVTGLDGMYYCSFDGSNGAIVEVARDNAYIKAMLKEEQKFWDMVLKKEAPPLTERDFVSMEDHQEWKQISARWIENKKLLDEAENQDKLLRNLLIGLSEDHNAEGHSVKISKSMCSGAIDYKQIMADHPHINWESYRKAPFTKWTFRATG